MRFAMKTLTYATIHLTVAVAVAWVLTRDWRIALAVGLVEPLVQTVAFTLHERAWAKADRRRSSDAVIPAVASRSAGTRRQAHGIGWVPDRLRRPG